MAKAMRLKKNKTLKSISSKTKAYKTRAFKNTAFKNSIVIDESFRNLALLIAGIIFGIVAFMHLVRLIFSIVITMNGHVVPMWISWVGFIISFLLCIVMYNARIKRIE